MKAEAVSKKTVPSMGFTPKVGSDVSPYTAEYQPKSACSTQNKAKRANEIMFLLLIRDQQVVGSNPIAHKNGMLALCESEHLRCFSDSRIVPVEWKWECVCLTKRSRACC